MCHLGKMCGDSKAFKRSVAERAPCWTCGNLPHEGTSQELHLVAASRSRHWSDGSTMWSLQDHNSNASTDNSSPMTIPICTMGEGTYWLWGVEQSGIPCDGWCLDAFSKWPEVKIVSSTTTQKIITVLNEIFATHGFPRALVSDNIPQFTSSEFKEFLQQNNITHYKSLVSNGLAENMVKNVKNHLKRDLTNSKSIPVVMSSHSSECTEMYPTQLPTRVLLS